VELWGRCVDNSIKSELTEILKREGWPKYTNHPADRGGPTKGGITLSTLRSWRGRNLLSEKALKELKHDEALSILHKRYVECNGIDRLSNTPLKYQVIDNAVLSGPFISVKDLQKSIQVKEDGIIGPMTLDAINKKGHINVNRDLAISRSLRLAKFVQKNPNQLVFLVGWLKRCLSFIN
jgi:lysozyme family protein